ncbi:MAG: hypothetical protein WCW87_00280 [Candidatus Paceibacterota bacterium]
MFNLERKNPVVLIKTSILLIVVIFIVSYGFYQARNIIAKPQIEITGPKDGSVFTKSFIEIDGKTKNINFISLNDRPIFVTEDGTFKEQLLLLPGYNIMKFYAKDKFGREVVKTLELMYKEQNKEGTTTPATTSTMSTSTQKVSTSTEKSKK